MGFYNEDFTILGSILGSPILGNYRRSWDLGFHLFGCSSYSGGFMVQGLPLREVQNLTSQKVRSSDLGPAGLFFSQGS